MQHEYFDRFGENWPDCSVHKTIKITISKRNKQQNMNDIFASLSSGAKFKNKNISAGSSVNTLTIAPKKRKEEVFLVTVTVLTVIVCLITAEASLFQSTARSLESSASSASTGARQRAASLDNDDNSDTGSAVSRDEKHTETNRTGTDRIESVEDANAIRNRLRIKVRGNGAIPHPALTFRDMELSEEIKVIKENISVENISVDFMKHALINQSVMTPQSVIVRNIEESDWKEPTPVQMQSVPLMLAQRDVLVAAPTGSGKTAAFTLPVLSKVAELSKKTRKGIQALMLAPTRELAEQIHREAVRLSAGKRLKICVLKKSIAAAALASNVSPC
jgi:primosomal protein N'